MPKAAEMRPLMVLLLILACLAVALMVAIATFFLSFVAQISQLSARQSTHQRALRRSRTPPPEIPHSDIHMVTFGTLGAPHDQGIDCSDQINVMRHRFEPHVASFRAYSPRDLPPAVTRPVSCATGCFPRIVKLCGAARHHFWRWKAHVVERQLHTIPEGSYLLWTDCNFKKYIHMALNPQHVRTAAAMVLEAGGSPDMGAQFSWTGLRNENCIDGSIMRAYPELRGLPHICSDRVLVRNSPIGRRIVADWREASDDPDILWPRFEDSASLIQLSDQGTLAVAVARAKKRGDLPRDWPNCVSYPSRIWHPDHVLKGPIPRNMEPLIRLFAAGSRHLGAVLPMSINTIPCKHVRGHGARRNEALRKRKPPTGCRRNNTACRRLEDPCLPQTADGAATNTTRGKKAGLDALTPKLVRLARAKVSL